MESSNGRSSKIVFARGGFVSSVPKTLAALMGQALLESSFTNRKLRFCARCFLARTHKS